MSPTQCAQFERVLEEQPDAPLSAAASAHMNGCDDCRLLWSELEAIRTAGMELGSEEVEPPEYLWTSLRQQLESEGLIRERSAQQGWLSGWFGAAPRWALAGAFLSLLLIAAMLAGYQVNEPNAAAVLPVRLSISAARPRLVASDLGKTLDGDLKRVFDSLPEGNPVLVSSLRENLGIVDNLIAVCEKSVREQPDDSMARDYLY
ncbi:MAG: hypothetical protein DMG32_19395, partial [Acidobacteria bacterium]